MTDVDLSKLADEITACAATVTKLKEDGGADAEAIKAAVESLLNAKRAYAAANNGLLPDGQPFVEKMTKAQKKAAAKAAAAASGEDAAAAAPGPAKPTQDPNSANALKKAAKKAEKAAKKAALKAGGGDVPADAAPAKEAIPAAAAAAAAPATTTAPTPTTTVDSGALAASQAVLKRLLPHVCTWNPNGTPPYIALATAVMCGNILDFTLEPNLKVMGPALGTSAGNAPIQGDVSMARYMARVASPNAASLASTFYPIHDAPALAQIDMWLDYSASLQRLDAPQRRLQAACLTLEKALRAGRTFCTGHVLTLADVALFGTVWDFPTTTPRLEAALAALPPLATATARWLRTLAVHPALQQATQLGTVGSLTAEVTDLVHAPALEPLVPGMAPLEGAVPGQVVTRFPPEPSGYLHIGHAKAVLLNDYYARRYQGRLILRFDDTNPSKEKEEYQESIVVDLAKLGVKPDLVTYASDYFDVCRGYAVQMIRDGLAYMDDTPQEQMKTERAARQDSKHRNMSVEQALEKFDLMCSGDPEGAAWCLRAKIGMQSNNGTLRDPVLYRQNLTPHHRTGTAFKAYPTYDFSCPIVDSIEGVTHALRTTEYNDRDEQFQWIAKALRIRRPRNHAFSRVNFEYTVLSKRKLTWFVDQGYVTGWDDARFPTVRGVVRRGIDIAALRAFMYAQGASRNVVNMVWHTFWANNKKEIDGKAKRYMAIDATDKVTLTITEGPAASDFVYKETDFHPKDPSMGTRVVRLASQVFLEKIDVDGMVVGEEFVLMRWGVFKVTSIGTDGLQATFVPDGDFKKAKRKLSWLADVPENTPVILYEFDNLVTKAKLEEEDNFEDHINQQTMATTSVIGDAGLKTCAEHEIIQLERRGFYRVDRPYGRGTGKPLELYMIPDGKAKPMSGLQGQLAHR